MTPMRRINGKWVNPNDYRVVSNQPSVKAMHEILNFVRYTADKHNIDRLGMERILDSVQMTIQSKGL